VDGRVFSRGVNVNRELSEAVREMQDIGGRLKHMDELNIDVQVLYPSLFLRPLTSKAEVEAAICRSYNQWLIDICRKGEGRLRWIAVVPLIDIASAVTEVQFAKANGACGIFMRGLVDDKRLSHPLFFPLYAEAQNADVPICVHASTGSFDWVRLFEGENGFMRFKVPVLSAFHSIVHDGIPAKFPKLRFGFIEVRAQWVPYMAVEIAKRFERENKRWCETSFAIIGSMSHARRMTICLTCSNIPAKTTSSSAQTMVITTPRRKSKPLRLLKKKGEVEPRIIDKILYDNAKALYGI
jgi:predicted TIM-barrel fold metal-dependent hydrolase